MFDLQAAAAFGLLAAAAPGSAAPAATPVADPVSIKPMFEEVCGGCHDVSIVTDMRKDRAGWETTVATMISRGAPLSDRQASQIVDYLARTYPADAK